MNGSEFALDPEALKNAHSCVDQATATEQVIAPEGESARLVIFGAPVRSGTTAMALIMAHSPGIDAVFMQPLKGLVRQEDSEFKVPPAKLSSAVFLKETYGPYEAHEMYNPVQMLMDSGVPQDHITYIPGVKDPRLFWQSCTRIAGENIDPELFASFWSYSLDVVEEMPADVPTLPFVYSPELSGNELVRINGLLRSIGLAALDSLDFNDAVLEKKLRLSNMFNNPERQKIFESTRGRGSYAYVEREIPDASQVPQSIGNLVERYEHIAQGNHL